MRTNRGVTIIEILLVVVLGGLLAGFVALSLDKVNTAEALDKSADTVASVLNEARSMTLSSVGDARYGVHFDTDQVVLFRGTSFDPNASTNVPTALNTRVAIQNISLNGGGAEVIFDKLTGKTSYNGSVQVALKSATTTYKTIIISATGLTERN
jgi:prepilin-type N-terminal cleavage/methylation domain-containing protein